MSTTKALRARWQDETGVVKWRRVCNLIKRGAARAEFEELLRGFPFSDEIPEFVDLRGIPYSGAVPIDPCHHFDFSFATKSKEAEDSELNLNVSDYHGSRFVGIKYGITVLGGKISECDFSFSNLKRTDFAFSGDIVKARFDGGSVSWSTFRGQKLLRCSFKNAKLSDCGFADVTLNDCSFEGADLRRCRFLGCEFSGGTSFVGASVRDVELPQRFMESSFDFAHVDPLPRVTIEIALEMARTNRTFQPLIPLLEGALRALDGISGEVKALEASLSNEELAKLENLIDLASAEAEEGLP